MSESDPAASATSLLSTDSTDSSESVPKFKRPLRLSTTIPTSSVQRSAGEQHKHDYRDAKYLQ